MVYVPGVTKVPHAEDDQKPSNNNSNNNHIKSTQIEGHLAPPQTISSGFQQQKKSDVPEGEEVHGKLLKLISLMLVWFID